MITLLQQNSKIAKDQKTFNFGIPAFMALDGFRTCPMAGTCAKGCYAKQGFYVMPNVVKAQHQRLALTKSDYFIEAMQGEINTKQPKRIRVHDSGDFYSREYLEKWIQLATWNPDTEFYAYTKMVSLVKSVKLPDNFTVIFSYGGREDHLINPDADRHSRVFESLKALKKAKYVDASVKDSNALKKNHRVGLIYHGAKSKNWGVA